MSISLHEAMRLAIGEAKKYEGATSPNPAVGAVALDSKGNILGIGAHQQFGGKHAEANLLKKLEGQPIDTVVVTLEPCCYFGKTPPCTQALITAGVKRVAIGVEDPNPQVSSKGIMLLRQAGIKVITRVMENECRQLIAPFSKWIRTKQPWVTVKRAFNHEGSMIPPVDQKTFTSQQSLTYAHQMRRCCDAIITGSQTILTDDPLFTIRHVTDHPKKSRWLVIMDRREKVSDRWMAQASKRGFRCIRGYDIDEVLSFLGAEGVLRVLVEAGPTLSNSFLQEGHVDEEVNIQQSNQTERITHVYRNH
jgi:diaminohydroxyphosphoribosylaminopyrimidine deaminase / 5-amino-6-(5-phosphoribosylamino)uracil reductase